MDTLNSAERVLVLHADDFGMNEVINSGILRTLRQGVLTSTSILANAPDVAAACASWPKLLEDLRAGSLPSMERRRRLGDRMNPFDIGIHLNLSQGRPLSKSYPEILLNDRGLFPSIATVFRLLRSKGNRFRDAVRAELNLQIERVMDHGIRLTHLNGHQYMELIPGVGELIPELLDRYSIPAVRIAREVKLGRTALLQGRVVAFGLGLVKHYYARKFFKNIAPTKFASPARYFGTSHAGLVDLTTFQRFLTFASQNGCTEIGLHPADAPQSKGVRIADGWNDDLENVRPHETSWLCGDLVLDLIEASGLKLGRLSEIAKREAS